MPTRRVTPEKVLEANGHLADKGLNYIDSTTEAALREQFEKLSRPGNADPVSLPLSSFGTKGYYIGKRLLESLFAHDFAHFDGISISFGRTPDDQGGELVLLVRGAHAKQSDDSPDSFHKKSKGQCLATYDGELIAPGVPLVIKNPPY